MSCGGSSSPPSTPTRCRWTPPPQGSTGSLRTHAPPSSSSASRPLNFGDPAVWIVLPWSSYCRLARDVLLFHYNSMKNSAFFPLRINTLHGSQCLMRMSY